MGMFSKRDPEKVFHCDDKRHSCEKPPRFQRKSDEEKAERREEWREVRNAWGRGR